MSILDTITLSSEPMCAQTIEDNCILRDDDGIHMLDEEMDKYVLRIGDIKEKIVKSILDFAAI